MFPMVLRNTTMVLTSTKNFFQAGKNLGSLTEKLRMFNNFPFPVSKKKKNSIVADTSNKIIWENKNSGKC